MKEQQTNYPVTDALLKRLDSCIQIKELSLFAKVYKTWGQRMSREPEICMESADTIWGMVLKYAGAYYSGGCLEICTKEGDEEYVLFFLQDGDHHIPKVDTDMLLSK